MRGGRNRRCSAAARRHAVTRCALGGAAALAVSTAAPLTAQANLLKLSLACGDTAGLVAAVAGTITDITLNSDSVGGCTYVLTARYGTTSNGLPAVNRPLAIHGNHSVILRDSADDFRLLQVGVSGDVVLFDLTLLNGSLGGALNQGTLELNASTVTGNTGDGIDDDAGSRLTLLNSTVSHNSGAGIVNGIDRKRAGGPVTLGNSHVADNGGSGVANGVGVLDVVSGSSVVRNGDGGILNLASGTVTVTSSSVESNRRSRPGGGIANGASGTVTVTESTVKGNAGGDGGGIWNGPQATLAVEGSGILGNDSFGDGGGVWNAPGGTVQLTHSNFASNIGVDGGGLWNSSGGVATVADSVFDGNESTGNTASEGNGGAISNDGSLLVERTTFLSNVAEEHPHSFGVGGAVANSGTAVIQDGLISGNVGGQGGAVANSGTLAIDGTPITGNLSTRSAGGAIVNAGTLRIVDASLDGNHAADTGFFGPDGYGGAIFNSTTGVVDMSGGELVGNRADTDGGAIYNQGSASVVLVTFADNTPDNCASGNGSSNGSSVSGCPV